MNKKYVDFNLRFAGLDSEKKMKLAWILERVITFLFVFYNIEGNLEVLEKTEEEILKEIENNG